VKILFIASYNRGCFAPFVTEQADALRRVGCEVECFGVVGKGVIGYLKAFVALKKKIDLFKPDVLHAHYGLCGLLANLQRSVPVVTTYHGSDINVPRVLLLSHFAMKMSAWNIYVSKKNLELAKPSKSNYSLIPCGIDLYEKNEDDIVAIKKQLGWSNQKKYVLFAGAFDNRVKNAPLAQAAAALLNDVVLIELKGYSRAQVVALLYSVNALLMTSFTEGSPQIIKETMSCGCPIVSVDVGDVKERISGLQGCFLAERTPQDIADKIKQAIAFGVPTKGRERIVESNLTNDLVAKQLIEIYSKVKNNG
jgi:teichuronic acid biosynthesis glycosyltransferase TuaC